MSGNGHADFCNKAHKPGETPCARIVRQASYDEHLISMAGGDGEPDLDAIQARADAATKGPWGPLDAQIRHTQIDGWTDPEGRRAAVEQTERDIQFVMHARADVPALLALVRDQAAKLGRVEALHRGNRWGFCGACSEHVDIPMPCPTRAAITATEASK